MQAILLEQPGVLKKIQKDAPESPAADEVLLKMRRLGVCGTDLHAYNGKQPFFTYPRVLGHEIAAEVVALGAAVKHLKIGDICAIMPYRNPVEDQAVRRGKTNCGSSLIVFGVHEDGAMQEYIKYPADLVFPANEFFLSMKQRASSWVRGTSSKFKIQLTIGNKARCRRRFLMKLQMGWFRFLGFGTANPKNQPLSILPVLNLEFGEVMVVTFLYNQSRQTLFRLQQRCIWLLLFFIAMHLCTVIFTRVKKERNNENISNRCGWTNGKCCHRNVVEKNARAAN